MSTYRPDVDRYFAGPFPAVCLAGSLSLFLGAALSDWAYAASYEIQWSNFASWLIVGALALSSIALVFALRDAASVRRRRPRSVAYAIVLVVMWFLGLQNAFVHARDAWATMPSGLWLSVVVAVLAAIATWMAFRSAGPGGAP